MGIAMDENTVVEWWINEWTYWWMMQEKKQLLNGQKRWMGTNGSFGEEKLT
jgi:hypothetical protein